MPQATNDWTAERVLALPDDGDRYEVVDGELLVSPSPELYHQDAVLALAVSLRSYAQSTGVGHVSISPADIELDEKTLVQPDVFVWERPVGRRPGRWKEIRTILLAVEVLSPSTARVDRQVKRQRYQRHGIPEYWIVDLDSRLFERWRPGDERPEILNDAIEWVPDTAKPSLTIDIQGFFSEVFET
jgi:Uma2 family endonuclease